MAGERMGLTQVGTVAQGGREDGNGGLDSSAFVFDACAVFIAGVLSYEERTGRACTAAQATSIRNSPWRGWPASRPPRLGAP